MPTIDQIYIDRILVEAIAFSFLFRTDYDYLNNHYRVHHNDKDIEEYIDRFMGHYKTNDHDHRPVASIFVKEDSELIRKCHQILECQETFQMHIGKGERWNMKAKALEYGDYRLIHQLNTGTVYIINSSSRTCIVLGLKESSLKEDVFHIIRSLMPRAAEVNGSCVIHAAGVRYKERGIMIVGESGNGKTTTFVDFILHGASPVSNDRVFIPSDPDQTLEMFEWPSFVNTSVGTMHKIKQLNHLIPTGDYENFEELWYSKIKLPIEPHVFKQIFNTEYLKSSKIDFIIFPRLRPDIEKCTLHQLDESKVSELLSESCYSPGDPAYLNWHRYFSISESHVKSQSEQMIKRLSSSIPAYLLEGGADLSDGIDHISKIINVGN